MSTFVKNGGLWQALEALEGVEGGARFKSARRLYDGVLRGEHVLGIEYVDGDILVTGALPGYQGALSDEPGRYVAPRGTQGVSVELVSGVVSARVYVGQLTQRQSPDGPPHVTVVMWAELSGAVVRAHWAS
ncbi:MAG: hypothetical protein HYY01_11175 [Chloroflexi bacterium]|nr:hypothetical protein [Chloroflexota bacterium]